MMAQVQKEDKYNLAPKKFNMWIFIFTSFMFFAALTSGFIVYTGGVHWFKCKIINLK